MREVKTLLIVLLYTGAIFLVFIGIVNLLGAFNVHNDVYRNYEEFLESISQGVLAVGCFLLSILFTLWANALLNQDNWKISQADNEKSRRNIEMLVMMQQRRRRPKE